MRPLNALSSSDSPSLTLGLPGFAFADLYRASGLRRLTEHFDAQLSEQEPELAQRFGATPPRPGVTDAPPRSLFDLALDNAVEGCTRETYGALVAHHQALHAGDEQVRTALARIAEDETRHAELSWDIERWAAPRLTDAERAQLREARREAIAALREEVSVPLAPELVTRAGLPTPEVARALLDTLARELWA